MPPQLLSLTLTLWLLCPSVNAAVIHFLAVYHHQASVVLRPMMQVLLPFGCKLQSCCHELFPVGFVPICLPYRHQVCIHYHQQAVALSDQYSNP